MSQMPEIKPVVNKEPESDKKKGGLLARLFGGGGSGGSAGLNGIGGLGGAGAGGGLGGLAGGGLLATKAGLIALILVGTGVAGGIGLVGYRLFGPGGDGTGSGDNLQVFAPKPKEAASADGASKDGSSASLQMLNQGNAQPKEPDAAASAAPKDATAADAANSASAAAAAATGPLNKAGNAGNGVNKGLMKNSGKFGALSTPGGGGGSGASASSAPAKPVVDLGAKGSLSGFKKGSGAATAGGTSRSLAKRFGGAAQQGFGVLANNKGSVASSAAGGQTYDGAGNGGSNIGGGTPIGGFGDSAGAATKVPTAFKGPNDSNTSTSVPPPVGVPACPWQNEIQKAQMLIGIGAALLMVASMLNKAPTPVTKVIVQVIGGLVAALGVMVALIGSTISHGKYSQVTQGMLLGAAGAGLGFAGAMVMTSSGNGPPDNNNDALNPPSSDGTAGAGGIMGMSPFILIGGGLAAGVLVASMMKFPKPKTYPASDVSDPAWPK